MDHWLFHLINQKWTNRAFDLFMAGLSDFAIWKPFLVVILLVAVIFGKFRARACILCMLLSLLVADAGTNILKTVIARPRPKQIQSARMVELARTSPAFLTLFHQPQIRYSDASDRHRSGPSFPSGHTTNNTVIAVCLTVFYPRRGWLYWILALAIGYSRIYLAAHWPSDVLGTIFLAIGEALIMIALLELAWRWLAPKWWPKVFARHPSLFAPPTQSSDLFAARSHTGSASS